MSDRSRPSKSQGIIRSRLGDHGSIISCLSSTSEKFCVKAPLMPPWRHYRKTKENHQPLRTPVCGKRQEQGWTSNPVSFRIFAHTPTKHRQVMNKECYRKFMASFYRECRYASSRRQTTFWYESWNWSIFAKALQEAYGANRQNREVCGMRTAGKLSYATPSPCWRNKGNLMRSYVWWWIQIRLKRRYQISHRIWSKRYTENRSS